MPTLDAIRTPALVLERAVLERNIRRMTERMHALHASLRPHLKTAKCARIATLATAGQPGGITVSTLAEAAYFAGNGFRDITYAVGIVPGKLDAVAALQRSGALVRLLTDDVETARAIVARAAVLGATFHVHIEVDTGSGRGGVPPCSAELVEIARTLHASPGVVLDGVLTHAGHAYHCDTVAGVERVAEEERSGVVEAATRLRGAGLPCPVVSAGSTPTAVHAASLSGITEMRPGNFVFFDLAQVGLGSCSLQDVAVSVMASVVSRRDGRVWVDAGSLALSADTSAGVRAPGVGYGVVCDLHGRPLGGATVVPGSRFAGAYIARVNQEHGLIETGGPLASLAIGDRVRILPNHACITAAMFDEYHVVDGGLDILDLWPRVRGW